MEIRWDHINKLVSKSYLCGHCGESLASENGWRGKYNHPNYDFYGYIYICHKCFAPTFFDKEGKQTPGEIFGKSIIDIKDKDVLGLYNEARKCVSSLSYTAAVLCCRKLLMHIAVAKGAKKNKSFIEYVEFLARKHYIPPGAKEDWVDHIRAKGNDANHEIILMKKEEAEILITFCGMLLQMIYEFPLKVPKKQEPQTAVASSK